MGNTHIFTSEPPYFETDREENMKGDVLRVDFFNRPTPMVAVDVLGKLLVHETTEGIVAGRIVETEAYLGIKDPACHASAGETKRNQIFHSDPGTVYVFSSFGIYNCTNVLTGGEEPAGCVLLRAVEPIAGLEIMRKHRQTRDLRQLTNGPGKLSEALGITRRLNGHSITKSPLKLLDCGFGSFVPAVDVRIGITKASHYPLRYFLTDSIYVSRLNSRLFSNGG